MVCTCGGEDWVSYLIATGHGFQFVSRKHRESFRPEVFACRECGRIEFRRPVSHVQEEARAKLVSHPNFAEFLAGDAARKHFSKNDQVKAFEQWLAARPS